MRQDREQFPASPQMSIRPGPGQIPGLHKHVQIPLIPLVQSLIHCFLRATKYFKAHVYYNSFNHYPDVGHSLFFLEHCCSKYSCACLFILCILDSFFEREAVQCMPRASDLWPIHLNLRSRPTSEQLWELKQEISFLPHMVL